MAPLPSVGSFRQKLFLRADVFVVGRLSVEPDRGDGNADTYRLDIARKIRPHQAEKFIPSPIARAEPGLFAEPALSEVEGL